MSSETIGSSHNSGSISKTNRIDELHHGYLHSIFRSVLRRKGYNSGFKEISHHINLTSAVPSETKATINLSRRQVNAWFNNNNGNL